MRNTGAVVFVVLLLFIVSTFGEESIGYIEVESAEIGHEIAGHLLENRLTKSAAVVPISSQHSSKKTGSKTASVSSTSSHLVLINTDFELIDQVKSAIDEISKSTLVLFSPASDATPHLRFVPSLTKSRWPSRQRLRGRRNVKTAGTRSASTASVSTASVSTPSASTPSASCLKSYHAKPKAYYVVLNDEDHETTIHGGVLELFVIIVEGNPSTGYVWKVDEANTSPALHYGPCRESRFGAAKAAPIRYSLNVIPSQAGKHKLTLHESRDGNRVARIKTIHIIAANS